MWKDEPEVVEFIQRILHRGPFERVVELGSYAMHDHDPRPLFNRATYIGVDARPGPGVDAVMLSHQFARLYPDGFDLAFSVSALEHDPFLVKSLWASIELVRRGTGIVAHTFPIGEWEEHDRECAPDGKHYRNPDPDDVREIVGLQCEILDEWGSNRTYGGAPWPRWNLIARRR